MLFDEIRVGGLKVGKNSYDEAQGDHEHEQPDPPGRSWSRDFLKKNGREQEGLLQCLVKLS